MIRGLGMGELMDMPGVWESAFEFSFDGYDKIYASVRVDLRSGDDAVGALKAFNRGFVDMVSSVNEEKERLGIRKRILQGVLR